MGYKVLNFGEYRQRRYYSKNNRSLNLPNLIEIQVKSFEDFINNKLDKTFREFFPIISNNQTLELKYNGLHLDEPRISVEQSKEKGKNYEAPLYLDLELVHLDGSKKPIRQKKLFFGDYPLMTEKGTFIVNGSEKVIISQLSRSQGAFFKEVFDKKIGKSTFMMMIIPLRGTWIETEIDVKDVILTRIDNNKRVPAITFLKSFGFSRASLLNFFGNNELFLKNLDWDTSDSSDDAMKEIFKKIKQGDPVTQDGAINLLTNIFFDKKYDLSSAGRYKINKKLNITQRVFGKVLASDIKDKDGNIVLAKNTFINKPEMKILKDAIDKKYCDINFSTLHFGKGSVVSIDVYTKNDSKEKITRVIGNDQELNSSQITLSDIIASFSYLLNLVDGIGELDDIDNLANRKVKTVCELLENQIRIGLLRIQKNVRDLMDTSIDKKITLRNIVNNKPLSVVIKEFFNTSQLSQFMDQTNILSELTNKRRLTALGPNGLSRERAGFEVRDVHYSHYGRICPIETPEGPNIGLISNLSTYARVNQYGFLETPYFVVKNGIVSKTVEHLTADDEKNKIIAQANAITNEDGTFTEKEVVCRFKGDIILAKPEDINYIDVSPKQVISVAASGIPFLENDDANRALMGANMQRQAVPLLKPSSPVVGTGVEHTIARDGGLSLVSKVDGKVTFVDARKIEITDTKHKKHVYNLANFSRSNQATCIHQKPLVKVGDHVSEKQILADGSSMERGELALGQNVMVAFTTWNGYNYEDAIILSERLVKEDVYTSIHIEEHIIESRETKLGPEIITRDIPNIPEEVKKFLDEDGIVMPGAEVREGDILIGKITPKGQSEALAEEKILRSLFEDKSKSVKDNSLRVPIGGEGVVHSVRRLTKQDGVDLPNDVNEIIKVYIVQKRKIQEGDKMAGRHGNKGVISKILPIEDMPYLEDGTPIDIMLNPLGVPSRMNIGQVLELHLGMAAKTLGVHVATPVFEGIKINELKEIMQEAKLPEDGKFVLYDGLTGKKFDSKISVGYMYMLKLAHMVEDKIHARNIGPYSLVTQQPLGGKAQNGGQRFGEMEVWALEAYGASRLLQELLTIKSDDIKGRSKTYESIIWKYNLPKPTPPESFSVLVNEIKALGINVDLKMVSKEEPKEELSNVQTQAELSAETMEG